MTDRELLELACKAGRYTRLDQERGTIIIQDDEGHSTLWNPLTDDGDALRLAVKLGVDIEFHTNPEFVEPWVDAFAKVGGGGGDELLDPDPYAATRRAIVRAAAEIGRSME